MTEIFSGCSGWYYEHWRGKFYPESLGKNKWLQFYSKEFNSVELNNTFYHFPRERNLKAWYSKVPSDFKFSVKANRSITHTRKFSNTEALIKDFYSALEFLGDKLGCILFQLPPQLKKNLDILAKIVEQLDKEKSNVLEFRDPSWFSEEVYEILRNNNICMCSLSAPRSSGLPEEIITTSDTYYIRFHGRDDWYSYNYSEEELRRWAEKIKALEVGSRNRGNSKITPPEKLKIFIYFNNDYEAYAPENCKRLRELIVSAI